MQEKTRQCDVLVVGGGPAGMMASIAAARAGARTVLLEKNSEPGIKLMMTGKGRCNLTNGEKDRRKFLEAFGRSGKFLYGAFGEFGPEDTIRFFEQRGVPTKLERGNRVFPASDQAGDVRRALLDEMKKLKVTLLRGTKVAGLETEGGRIMRVWVEGMSVSSVAARSVVVATGGLSYPGSGSTGDGFNWAEKAGHMIIAPRPALTPVIVREKWVPRLEGLSLKHVRVSVWQEGKKLDERFGEALFTERGMSGPVILDLSKKIGELLDGGEVKLMIDFKPAVDFPELDQRIQKDFQASQNRQFKHALDDLLPQKLIPVVIDLSGIPADKKVNLVTREERKKVLHLLKGLELTVDRLRGFDKAVVTAGGVHLREVDPKTMRSKLSDNLYFAGEVLDLDAPTGGYNLQAAWSTGYLAGKSAGEAAVGLTE